MNTAALLAFPALLVACSSAQPEPAEPADSSMAAGIEPAAPLVSASAGTGRLITGDKGCPATAPRHGDACSMRGQCRYGGDAAAASDLNGPRSCRCAGDMWECTGAP